MEFFSISVPTVYAVSKSSGATTPGVGNKYFSIMSVNRKHYLNQQLIGMKYPKSAKSFKVKRIYQKKLQ